MSDIVERLRNQDYRGNRPPEHALMAEAADEIERLRAALELIVDGLPTMDGRHNIDSARFAAGVLERGE